MSLSTYEIIMQQKKEAKRIAELFRESVVLKNILSDHDLKIMLNEIKKHFEKSGIEFIKKYPTDEAVNEYSL
jgi:UTP-glucose-1-phosphate uridylyltransferase